MQLASRLLTIGLLVTLAACDRQQQATSPSYEVAVDNRHTMAFIIDPAADVVWDSAGFIITAAGEQDLAPATPEDWVKVEAAAAVLAESGNLLMMPGRAAGPDPHEIPARLVRHAAPDCN
jgi:hypothetical protein